MIYASVCLSVNAERKVYGVVVVVFYVLTSIRFWLSLKIKRNERTRASVKWFKCLRKHNQRRKKVDSARFAFKMYVAFRYDTNGIAKGIASFSSKNCVSFSLKPLLQNILVSFELSLSNIEILLHVFFCLERWPKKYCPTFCRG